ncbi:hypothetical protein NNC19_19945 [Clostridium sp. SHJSY1]|uniref:hypothetical protein n=1 Tax=Clostridium sp. SHJSY1 TaxID=2942483 RepID=UPI002874562E|nr:hypothetical protein [Clostridium sp. SHJSY1]MDS0527970.1 hypothetical protein [Clostridium sp. SHJSY1]
MKYYIVALFDEDSYESIVPIQRNLSKKFRGNRHSPMPYIVLDILDNPNIDKLYTVIDKIIKPYKKFKIELCDDVSISDTMKTINLKILNEGYIKKINRSLKDTLELHGIHPKNFNNELSISLAHINYFNKDNKRNSDIACDLVKKDDKNITLKINKLEIWKISNNKRETCIKSYPLKAF